MHGEQTANLVEFGRLGLSGRRPLAEWPRRRRQRRPPQGRLREGDGDAHHDRRLAVLLEWLQRVLAHVHGVGPGGPEQGVGRARAGVPPRRDVGEDVGLQRRGQQVVADLPRRVQ